MSTLHIINSYTKNYIPLCLGLFIAHHLYTPVHLRNPNYMPGLSYTAILHFGLDLGNTKSADMRLHHIVGICISLYTIFRIDTTVPSFANAVYSVMSTEISTIFYVFRDWLKEYDKKCVKKDWHVTWLPRVRLINDLLFFGSFAYTRVYLYTKEIMFNSEYNNQIKIYNTDVFYTIYTSSVYILYILNIYWFSILCKGLFKHFKCVKLVSCEYLLQYTYSASLIYTIYGYWNYLGEHSIYYLDILGYVLVTVSSYLYHNALYKKLTVIYPETNVDVMDIVPIYLFDIFCVNAKTWLTGYVHHTVTHGFLQSYKFPIIIFMGVAHIVSFLLYCWYIYSLKKQNTTFTVDMKPDNKTKIINVIIGLPIVINIVISAINNHDRYYLALNMMLNLGINSIILFMVPFYQMNHLALHMSLLWMTVILVECNTGIIKN